MVFVGDAFADDLFGLLNDGDGQAGEDYDVHDELVRHAMIDDE